MKNGVHCAVTLTAPAGRSIRARDDRIAARIFASASTVVRPATPTRRRAGCQIVCKLQKFHFRHASNRILIDLTINGEAKRFDRPLNCQQLLDQLELAGKRVAVERNGEIVPRSRHGEQMLANGDKLEIVVAVGGG